jgi:hypothetical protein
MEGAAETLLDRDFEVGRSITATDEVAVLMDLGGSAPTRLSLLLWFPRMLRLR